MQRVHSVRPIPGMMRSEAGGAINTLTSSSTADKARLYAYEFIKVTHVVVLGLTFKTWTP